jgi:hypothetical protein
MATLQVVRRILLAILIIGFTGTSVELLLLSHFEDSIQLIPLATLGLGLVVLVWHAFRASRTSLLALQVVMSLFLAAGLAGIFYHVRASLEFQREFDPALKGVALLWPALRAHVPPALAPAVLVQFALIGLAYTYRQRGELR